MNIPYDTPHFRFCKSQPLDNLQIKHSFRAYFQTQQNVAFILNQGYSLAPAFLRQFREENAAQRGIFRGYFTLVKIFLNLKL